MWKMTSSIVQIDLLRIFSNNITEVEGIKLEQGLVAVVAAETHSVTFATATKAPTRLIHNHVFG